MKKVKRRKKTKKFEIKPSRLGTNIKEFMKLRVVSTHNFISLLKKLKVIEKSILLEITEDKVFSKIHTPDKSVMKYAAEPFKEVFEGDIDWDSLGCDRIKVGIMDVTRLIDSFKHFRSEEDIFVEIQTASLNDQCVATEIFISSTSLKITIKCADLSLLSYVEDDILTMVHSKQDYIHKFPLYQSDFSSIAALCSLENNNDELLQWEVNKDKVLSKGNSFEYTLNIGSSDIEMSDESPGIYIYKYQLGFVDIGSSDLYVHHNRIVIFSECGTTSTAIGLVSR